MNEQDLNELIKNLRNAKHQRKNKFSVEINQLVHTYEERLRREFFWSLNNVSLIKGELDSEYDINETVFYDFRVNLIDVDYINSNWEPNGSKTDYKKVVCGFLTNKETHLTLLRKQILERGYFNINDAAIKDFKKPSYIIELKKAEKTIKSLGLIKNDKSTELNHLVSKYRALLLDQNGEQLPFNFVDLILFLKNLVQLKFEETVSLESKKYVKNHPKVIESLKIVLDKIE
jgi:hypothetical protein